MEANIVSLVKDWLQRMKEREVVIPSPANRRTKRSYQKARRRRTLMETRELENNLKQDTQDTQRDPHVEMVEAEDRYIKGKLVEMLDSGTLEKEAARLTGKQAHVGRNLLKALDSTPARDFPNQETIYRSVCERTKQKNRAKNKAARKARKKNR